MTRKLRKLIIIAPLAALGIVVFMAIGGVVVQLLWNWLLPTIFGWREITFWQALGLLALCRILFGGHGLHGSGRSRFRRRVAERLEQMPPEERERFREAIRKRWGVEPPPSEDKGE